MGRDHAEKGGSGCSLQSFLLVTLSAVEGFSNTKKDFRCHPSRNPPLIRQLTKMPLTARLRDEENERINTILKRLMGLDYVPENGNAVVDEVLSGIGLNLQMLLDFSTIDVIHHIEKSNFDWANAEQFADYLLKLGSTLPESKFRLAEKAIAIYQHIQTQSKTFSLEIHSKINSIQK